MQHLAIPTLIGGRIEKGALRHEEIYPRGRIILPIVWEGPTLPYMVPCAKQLCVREIRPMGARLEHAQVVIPYRDPMDISEDESQGWLRQRKGMQAATT